MGRDEDAYVYTDVTVIDVRCNEGGGRESSLLAV